MCRGWGWHGFGPQFGFGHWGPPHHFTKEEAIRYWEEYQKDLEEELAEVAGRIERLKKSAQPREQTAAA